MKHHTLVWLRNDLRTTDNPALDAALATGGRVTAIYVYEKTNASRPITGAALWWLEKSLAQLGISLARKNIELLIKTGDPAAIFTSLIEEKQITAVFWNRRYAPAERDYDADLKLTLKNLGLSVCSFAGNLLVEPWHLKTGTGGPYQVFTPFAKSLRLHGVDRPSPISDKAAIKTQGILPQHQTTLAQPKWAEKLENCWQVGEAAPKKLLSEFFEDLVGTYKDDRDRPSVSGTSKLSPYLRFGEISARQIWHFTTNFTAEYPSSITGGEKFLSELIWRDFHYHQLFHRADITTQDMRPTLGPIDWHDDKASFNAWTKGQTGIPIIDAGMRQLWETGWMHNRVRMLVASFLTKNLLIDWRCGESWFWDTLVDADVASNPGSWQWVAGCGMDAAPYFRVFNPVVQGKRFDPDGAYVRQWVPELRLIPSKWVHCPAQAPDEVLRQAGLKLGGDYPFPIADLSASQQLFKQIMKG